METRASSHNSRRPYLMAMVLGSALSAVAPAVADTVSAQKTTQTINDLGRYCSTCWRNARLPIGAWNDCTQEVFSRLLERVPATAWTQVLGSEGQERREFLRAIDAVKKRTQRSRKWGNELDGVADDAEANRKQIEEKQRQVSEAAAELLSERQQRILQLSFEGWSVAEMARELEMPTERVSDEKYKAIRKLRVHLAGQEDSAY